MRPGVGDQNPAADNARICSSVCISSLGAFSARLALTDGIVISPTSASKLAAARKTTILKHKQSRLRRFQNPKRHMLEQAT